MSNTILQQEGGSTAQTLSPNQVESLSRELLEHLTCLRSIRPAIRVSVLALRRQDAEDDPDVASVLEDSACGPLDDEIERIELLLATQVRRCELLEVCA